MIQLNLDLNYLTQYFEITTQRLNEYSAKSIDEVMGSTMIDYVITSVAETQIMDVFEHNKSATKTQEVDDKPEYEQDGNGEEAK